jgi:antitoxin YefM
MKELTMTQFRQDADGHMDAVLAEHAPIVLKRDGGDVVMISFEDFERFVSGYLLQSPRNAEALRESVAELAAGGGRAIDRS